MNYNVDWGTTETYYENFIYFSIEFSILYKMRIQYLRPVPISDSNVTLATIYSPHVIDTASIDISLKSLMLEREFWESPLLA